MVRCAAPLAAATTVTFTVTEPAGAEHQFDNVWTHTYTVAVQPNSSFVGTGVITGIDQLGTFDHAGRPTPRLTRTSPARSTANTVSYVSTRPDGLVYIVNNAPTDGSLFHTHAHGRRHVAVVVRDQGDGSAVHRPDDRPSLKTTASTSRRMGGGKEAAQACAGMPINSTQGK